MTRSVVADSDRALLRSLARWQDALLDEGSAPSLRDGRAHAARLLCRLLFCRMLEEQGLWRGPVPPTLPALDDLAELRLGVRLFGGLADTLPAPALLRLCEGRDGLGRAALGDAGFDVLGHVQERARGDNKHTGVYYSGPQVAGAMAEATVGRLARDAGDRALACWREGERATAHRLVQDELFGLRILDPACGAGAFLVAAAEVLLREHERLRDTASELAAPDAAARIVSRCLYGVDRDADAVAVARLNLWRWYCRVSGVLPLPATQLGVADSLVDPWPLPLPSAPPPLDGAFDVVLGNPPYLGEEGHKDLFRATAAAARVGRYYEAKMDYAGFFVHLGLDLVRRGGLVSFLLPSYLPTAHGARRLNRRLCEETAIELLCDFGEEPLFRATAPGLHSIVLRLRKEPSPTGRPVVARLARRPVAAERSRLWLPLLAGPPMLPDAAAAPSPWRCHLGPPQHQLLDARGALRLAPPEIEELLETMARRGRPLGGLYQVDTGIQAGPNAVTRKALAEVTPDTTALRPGQGVFVLSREERAALGLSEEELRLLRPFHPARQVRRYRAEEEVGGEILYLCAATCPDPEHFARRFPRVERHLRRFLPLLMARRECRLGRKPFYHLHWPRTEQIFLDRKLLGVRQTGRPCFALSEGPYFVDLAVNVIRPRPGAPDLAALLAVLNAAPAHLWFRHRGKRKGDLLQIDGAPLEAFPVPAMSTADEATLAALGLRLTKLHSTPGADADIREAEDEVDQLVADLFGVSLTGLSA